MSGGRRRVFEEPCLAARLCGDRARGRGSAVWRLPPAPPRPPVAVVSGAVKRADDVPSSARSQGVATWPASEPVIAGPAVKFVAPATSVQPVVATAAVKAIVAGAAVEQVGPSEPSQVVRSGAAPQPV